MSESNPLVDELQELEQEALAQVEAATDPDALETVRIRFLGRKDGRISGVLRKLGGMDPEVRPVVGAEANRVKQALQEALEAREAVLAAGGGSGESTPWV